MCAAACTPPAPFPPQLSNITAPVRFHGELNVDLNEIATNLVPFPTLQFVTSSMAPFPAKARTQRGRWAAASRTAHGKVDELFVGATSRFNALVSMSPDVASSAVSAAAGVLARGQGVQVSDLERNIHRITGLRNEKAYGLPAFWAPRKRAVPLRLAAWNIDGVKTGLTAAPPPYAPAAVTILNNSSGIAEPLRALRSDFLRLYNMRAHLHHYTAILQDDDMVGPGAFGAALDNVTDLITAYEGMPKLGQAAMPDVFTAAAERAKAQGGLLPPFMRMPAQAPTSHRAAHAPAAAPALHPAAQASETDWVDVAALSEWSPGKK